MTPRTPARRAPATLRVLPATRERWTDVEVVFEARGCSVARGCWCMFYRQSGVPAPPPKGVTRADANRAKLKALVDAGEVPGLVGYRGKVPVGWVSLGPREGYRKLERSPVMKAVDDRPVWSIVCFVVPAAFRGQGVARGLLDGAIAYAKKRGVTLLSGFEEVARRKPRRPIVRLVPGRRARG